jgi:hypothetical protein
MIGTRGPAYGSFRSQKMINSVRTWRCLLRLNVISLTAINELKGGEHCRLPLFRPVVGARNCFGFPVSVGPK